MGGVELQELLAAQHQDVPASVGTCFESQGPVPQLTRVPDWLHAILLIRIAPSCVAPTIRSVATQHPTSHPRLPQLRGIDSTSGSILVTPRTLQPPLLPHRTVGIGM